MRKMISSKIIRFLSMILCMMLVIGLVNQFSSSADSGESIVVVEENDITKYVDISLNDFFIQTRVGNNFIKKYIYQDGNPTNETGDAYTLKLNGIVAMSYKWGISSENMPKVKDGSYFTFKLPDQSILDASEVITEELFDTKDKKIGHFTVSADGIVKVTLEGDFSTTSVLKNGIIGVFSKVKSVDFENIVFSPKSESSSAFVLPVKTFNPSKVTVGGDGDHGIFNNPTYHQSLGVVNAFKKEAQQLEPSNHIQFTFRINYEDIRSIYEKRAEGDAPLGSPAYSVKKNVYLVDEGMPEGLEIAPNLTKVQIYYWAPKVDSSGNVTKELSNQTIDSEAVGVSGGKITLGDKTMFTIREGEGTLEEWKAFRDEIIAENKRDKSSRIIGIFNKKYLVVTVGDMPNDQILYGDFYNNSKFYDTSIGIFSGADYLKKVLFPKYEKSTAGNKRITAEQSKYMQNAYAGKPIVDFVLRVIAIPKGKTEASYSNKATMYWDDVKTMVDTGSVRMSGAFGIVEMEPFTGKYEVSKEWKGEPASEVRVQLLKNGSANGSPVTLNAGNGWKHTFENLNDGGGTAVFSVEELNVPEKYRSVVEPVSGKYASIIKNYEQVEIKLRKKWKDGEKDLVDPKVNEVTFYLHKATETNPTPDNAKYKVVLKKENATADKSVWEKTVKVDKKDDENQDIVYKVSEEKIEDFTQEGEASGDMTSGFTITNKLIPKLPTGGGKPNKGTTGGGGNSGGGGTTGTLTPKKETTETVVKDFPSDKPSTPSTGNPYTPPFYPPTPEVTEVVTNSERPVAIVPVPTIPETPSNIPIIDEDLDIIVDTVPRGDADLDIDIIGDDVPKGDSDIKDENLDVNNSKTPRGGKILAKTGGLRSIFFPVFGLLIILLISFFVVHFMIKKSK